jgi:serine protease Do
MIRKILALFCIFNLSCVAVDYKRLAYNSVAMVKFESIDQKSKEGSWITGTAFAVDENYLITAAHVCKAGVEQIVLPNLTNFSVYLVYVNKDENMASMKDFRIVDMDIENDLCLIYKNKHGLVPVVLTAKELKIRDSVYTVGAPGSAFPIEAEGFVSLPHIDMMSGPKDRMILSLDVYSGNSGGPIFDDKGRMVGVLVAAKRDYLHLGIAVKSKYVIQFIKKYSAKQLKVKIREE